MCQPIGIYEYTYGAGNTPNRKIDFFGNNEQIWGVVCGKTKQSWREIGKVDECHMIKEGASTTEKMRIMMAAREHFQQPQYPCNEPFNGLPYETRVSVITNLVPTGKYRIMITNNIGENPFFEKVENLTFFDPS